MFDSITKVLMAPAIEHSNIRRLAFLGGFIGLVIGLFLWAWPYSRPLQDVTQPLNARHVPSSSRPEINEPALRTLNEQGSTLDTSSSTVSKNESPRSAAIRFVWNARFLEGDFKGALLAIRSASLGQTEESEHIGDLIDILIDQSWYEEKIFPGSVGLELLLGRPRGRELLGERWAAAIEAISLIEPSPRKVRFLARMELAAQMLRKADSESLGGSDQREKNLSESQTFRSDDAKSQAGTLPPIQEIDDKGNPLDAAVPAASAAETPTPLLDYESVARNLRKEIGLSLEALPTRNSIWHLSWIGWGLLRTSLLAALGSLTAAVGGLLNKKYSASIADLLTRTLTIRSATKTEPSSLVPRSIATAQNTSRKVRETNDQHEEFDDLIE
jgi:hypothetical protein